MTNQFQETRAYIKNLVEQGDWIEGLSEKQRTKLISNYVSELTTDEWVFEDHYPGRFILSRFMDYPESNATQRIFINELTDCIFQAHESVLKELFDEVQLEVNEARGVLSDREEFLREDNRARHFNIYGR